MKILPWTCHVKITRFLDYLDRPTGNLLPRIVARRRVLPKTEKNANACFSTVICYNLMTLNHFTEKSGIEIV
jgi:hypothetical protein